MISAAISIFTTFVTLPSRTGPEGDDMILIDGRSVLPHFTVQENEDYLNALRKNTVHPITA